MKLSYRPIGTLVIASAALIATQASATAAELAWIPRDVGSDAPGSPSHNACAYDTAREVTVLFIGTSTWEYDGNWWTLRTTDGPSTRQRSAMAYDSQRGVCVLFGGSETIGGTLYPVGEMWEWNGQSWTQRSADPSPTPRYGHAMTYDAARGVTVLFGGHVSGGRTDDTWEWDGASWTLAAAGGPAAVEEHALAFDSARGVSVLVGGNTTGGVFGTASDQHWEWDGTTWTEQIVLRPAARFGHTLSYDAIRQRIVLSGGVPGGGGSPLDETWEWDGIAWLQASPTTTPGQRYDHAMAYDVQRGVSVLFGTASVPVDTWEWDGTEWSYIAPPSPLRTRALHGMAFDATRAVSVLFGGNTDEGRNGETWEWDGLTWALAAADGPPAMTYTQMAFDTGRDVTVLFGGWANGGWSDDLWEWAGTTWTPIVAAGPPAVNPIFNTMAYDRGRDRTVLVTADAGGTATWEYDGASWTLMTAAGPPQLMRAALAYDAVRNVCVLFGGKDLSSEFSSDTWEWDGTTWALAAAAGPAGRWGHALAFDQQDGRVILAGGHNDDGYLGDTWAWDGSAWSLLAATVAARRGHAMIYDDVRHRIVMVGGGSDIAVFGDTWELAVPGDYDGDGDVDDEDFAAFADCMSGPGVIVDGDCQLLDLNADRDVDLSEFAVIQCGFGQL